MLDGTTGPLSPQQMQAYRQDGLIIPDYRVPDPLLADMRAALDRLIDGNPDIRPERLVSAHIARDPTEKVKGDDAFLEFAHHPPILDMVQQLIGPDVILWGCQVFCKPAKTGMEVPWHQDGRYWPIRPLATCTVWVALDDVSAENGCMRFIPGSHRQGHTFRHKTDNRADLVLDLVLEDGEADMKTARDVVLPAGRMSMHDVYLVHGSNPNTSGKRRAGVAMRYMPATSQFDRETDKSRTMDSGYKVDFANRPIWLARGQDRAGNTKLQHRG